MTLSSSWLQRGRALTAAATTFGVLSLVAVGCGKDNKRSNGPDGLEGARGVVQGVLLNGLTNERIAIPGGNHKQGVRVLANQTYKLAEPRTRDKRDENHLKGEFFIRGVPLDRRLPIIAHVDGYQPFEGYVEVKSAYEDRTKLNNDGEVVTLKVLKENPTMIANIRLYPVGTEAEDLKLTVQQDGTLLAGAIVQLRPVLENVFAVPQAAGANTAPTLVDANDFLLPRDARMQFVKTETNDEGVAEFRRDQLVLGGKYKLLVIPRAGTAQSSVYSEEITVGLHSKSLSLTDNPYNMVINLESAELGLKVLYSNLDKAKHNAEGKLEIKFNRPIEIAPGSAETMVASLQGGAWAELYENRANFDGPETMSYEVRGDVLVLRPRFRVQPDLTWETGLRVNYANVRVVPAGSSFVEAKDVADLLRESGLASGAEVAYIAGSKPRPVPTAMTAYLSGSQLKAKVTSRYAANGAAGDYGFENHRVTFRANAGRFVLAWTNDSGVQMSDTGHTFTMVTDAYGETNYFEHGGKLRPATLTWEPGTEGTRTVDVTEALGKLPRQTVQAP